MMFLFFRTHFESHRVFSICLLPMYMCHPFFFFSSADGGCARGKTDVCSFVLVLPYSSCPNTSPGTRSLCPVLTLPGEDPCAADKLCHRSAHYCGVRVVCVCVHVCAHVHVCACTCMHVCTHVHVCWLACALVCMCERARVIHNICLLASMQVPYCLAVTPCSLLRPPIFG